MRKESPAIRVWRHVSKTAGCWLWTGGVTRHGYGRFYPSHGRYVLAHRYVWTLTRGALTPAECLLHRCDVPACVNPDHLFVGTKTDNAADRDAKQRQARGERVNNAKLTAATVAHIRSEYTGKYGQRVALMRRYSIGSSAFHSIITRQTWRHI